MADNYGASQEAWHHWAVTLGLAEHLLPVVANPGAEISPDSKVQALGKTPTRYNFRGAVAGFAKWTEWRSSMKEIGQWELVPDYGICVQARAVRAIDIDVPSVKRSRNVLEVIESALPAHFFTHRRTREGTGKLLLPFLYEGEMPKAVLNVPGGVVELLGDGQQWIAESSYLVADEKDKSKQRVNGRYLWPAGWPAKLGDLPLLSADDLISLRQALELILGQPWPNARPDEPLWKIARVKRERPLVDARNRPGAEDPIAEWLLENWDVRDEGRGGELFIRCPFDSEHTSDSGPTETVYYPAGTGGFERGHFKCLHAHCTSRSDDDYLGALGYVADLSDAPYLEPLEEPEADAGGGDAGTAVDKPAPRYMIDKQGRKEGRAYNHELFLRDAEAMGLELSWDDFTAQMVYRKAGQTAWRVFGDEHYQQIVRQMDRNGFVPQSASSIRSAVNAHAVEHRVDTLADWVNTLPEWDGVKRVERFWITYGKAADTPYVRAIGLYSWTAQAGRALDPGCQADMVPILVGEQGVRKTSLVRAIAPDPDQFVEINLMHRDDDTTRNMRGTTVGELGELRGMRGRDKEDTKAFITKRVEKWVPKYKEFPALFARRLVLYGTTNMTQILSDDTGERRWLPFEVGLGGEVLDVEAVEQDRLQLWAEAVALWRSRGVVWQDAERLAEAEHGRFKDEDPWAPVVLSWLLTEGALDDPELAPVDLDYQWGANEVLIGALGRRVGDLKRGDQMRVGSVLKGLGCWKKQVWGQGWRYRAFREKLIARDADEELFA